MGVIQFLAVLLLVTCSVLALPFDTRRERQEDRVDLFVSDIDELLRTRYRRGAENLGDADKLGETTGETTTDDSDEQTTNLEGIEITTEDDDDSTTDSDDTDTTTVVPEDDHTEDDDDDDNTTTIGDVEMTTDDSDDSQEDENTEATDADNDDSDEKDKTKDKSSEESKESKENEKSEADLLLEAIKKMSSTSGTPDSKNHLRNILRIFFCISISIIVSTNILYT